MMSAPRIPAASLNPNPTQPVVAASTARKSLSALTAQVMRQSRLALGVWTNVTRLAFCSRMRLLGVSLHVGLQPEAAVAAPLSTHVIVPPSTCWCAGHGLPSVDSAVGVAVGLGVGLKVNGGAGVGAPVVGAAVGASVVGVGAPVGEVVGMEPSDMHSVFRSTAGESIVCWQFHWAPIQAPPEQSLLTVHALHAEAMRIRE
jgi:hypothetical protein